jgi:hypothetical protein
MGSMRCASASRYAFPHDSRRNYADRANKLLVQMIVFSCLMMWAYNANEYNFHGGRSTSIWRPLWDRYVLCPVTLLV